MLFICTKSKKTAKRLLKAGYKLFSYNSEQSIYLFENNPSLCFDHKRFEGAVFTNTINL